MNLLIVNDDVIATQGIIQGIDFAKIGIDEVRAAYDAGKARAILADWPVDLILCDIEMPGESGIELLAWVHECLPEIESIILSCHADFEFAQQAVRLGCLDYVISPVSYEELTGKLSSAVAVIRKKAVNRQKLHYGDLWIREKIDASGAVSESSHASVVRSAKDYIDTHLGDPELSVSMLADLQHLNRDHFNRIFKKYENMNIRDYIIQERMKLAGELLREKRFGIGQVAVIVGYENYPSFVVSFKKYYKMSPKEYMTAQTEK